MNRFALIFLTLLFQLLGLTTAHADILLLNMNNATQEVAELQRLSQSTGERLYILPFVSGNSEYITADLAKDILTLASRGVRPRVVIASGHHYEEQYYYGSNGKIFLHKIDDEIRKLNGGVSLSNFFSSVQSLYLWGCYTGTLANTDDLIYARQSPFPNARYVVGFAKKGPLGTTAASGQLLRKSIEQELSLRSAPEYHRTSLVRSITGGSAYDLIVHDRETFFNKSRVSTRQQFTRECLTTEAKETFLRSQDLLHAYNDNVMGEISEDTAGGPLRQLYEGLQEHLYCMNKNGVKIQNGEQLKIRDAIRLVYYKKVITNFSNIYAAQLQRAHELLSERGLRGTEILMALDKTPRGEVIARLKDLRAQNVDLHYDKVNEDLAKAEDLYFIIYILEDVKDVVFPHGIRVPSSWTEAGAKGAGKFRALNTFSLARKDAVNEARCLFNKGCEDEANKELKYTFR